MAGIEDVVADPDTEEALAEFDFLVSENNDGAGGARSQGIIIRSILDFIHSFRLFL